MFGLTGSPGNRAADTRAFARLLTGICAVALACGPLGATAAAFECGDLTQDGAITAADVISIVNYVFKGGPTPEPPECADVNHDYAVTSADAISLIGFIFRGGAAPSCPPEGVPVTHGGCKLFTVETGAASPAADQDCMFWLYDGLGTLQIQHLNAGFNCCPGEIHVAVEHEVGLIRIIESEHFDGPGGCDCLCLFDLQYEIGDVAPGDYTITVEEPYRNPGDDPLQFEVTLPPGPASDSHCVARSSYPWGMVTGPVLRIVTTFGCKPFDAAVLADSVPSNQDCAVYRYDAGNSVLYLDHLNAGFNCCPVIGADMSVAGDLITITERESPDSLGFCFCLCLFDVSYEIWELPPGAYTIRFVELYLEPGDEPLEFPVDLATTPEGTLCELRPHYPWEY